MEITWEPLREPGSQEVWEKLLRPIAAELRSCATDLAERATARMQAEMPVLFPDPQAVTGNVVSSAAGIRQLADIIDVAGDPRDAELPPPTLAIARTGAQRQIPLASLMRFYRVAQELVWQWMFDRITACAADRKQQTAAVRLATRFMFDYVDAALNRAEQVYEAEREVWLRNATAARSGAIDDILTHRERDHQRASKRLRYDINRHHVGAIAWSESVPEDRDAHRSLNEALTIVAGEVGAETTLLHPAGSLVAFGWLSRQSDFATVDFGAGTTARRPKIPDGVRVSVGEPGHGLKGFRDSHIQAENARRVASLTGKHAAPLTRYRDVAVAALASCDPEHAASFVHRVLGPLAADDEATYRVATTLSVYLQENRSRVRAARRLTVHPNTVSYRVDQAQTILGRSIDTDSLDLAVALVLLPTLPGLVRERAGADRPPAL
ncbi:PucR family transcriptional regulator [Mycobacterium sp. Marseille-P9652]|uniref:PucR family transcriptional regulator n=1 Tax=Mycobacterium sp. Marseille-P9652 TaxID=2654950 RepID=UPI0012E7B956|nr:helix-turn-helix domain-containing protein [Mycobacterium sp. Marseille-P9652]